MKKQKLIENINKIAIETPFPKSKIVDHLEVIKLIEQLDEPEKVKVPQFVADWIEYCKVKKITLAHALNRSEEAENKNVFSWIVKDSGNQETFARAWLDGYEVEKEKKYKITLLNRNDGHLYLVNQNAALADKYGHFSPVVLLFTKSTNFSEKCYKLTKKDVVANGFGWVFDCPGTEIEEVE
ncbi:DUF1642 domain-containing protein [Streptococcus mitis]|uniref:DUF1642 domain-containing protein n=1 Tax=Streptococcus mitis TaxID=28037 RepID=UPI0039C043A8